METFGFIVALFGLALFLIAAAIPVWITFLVVRFVISQINKVYRQVINFKK